MGLRRKHKSKFRDYSLEYMLNQIVNLRTCLDCGAVYKSEHLAVHMAYHNPPTRRVYT